MIRNLVAPLCALALVGMLAGCGGGASAAKHANASYNVDCPPGSGTTCDFDRLTDIPKNKVVSVSDWRIYNLDEPDRVCMQMEKYFAHNFHAVNLQKGNEAYFVGEPSCTDGDGPDDGTGGGDGPQAYSVSAGGYVNEVGASGITYFRVSDDGDVVVTGTVEH